MPDAIRRRRSTRAHHAVGLPALTVSVAGMPPTGTDPAIVSVVSPGRISGHTSVVLPDAPVMLRFVIGRSCASALNARLVEAPALAPGLTVTVSRFSARLSAPKIAPVE